MKDHESIDRPNKTIGITTNNKPIDKVGRHFLVGKLVYLCITYFSNGFPINFVIQLTNNSTGGSIEDINKIPQDGTRKMHAI